MSNIKFEMFLSFLNCIGIKLKPAVERAPEPRVNCNNTGGTDALADALRRALEARERAMQASSDSEDNADEDEWED